MCKTSTEQPNYKAFDYQKDILTQNVFAMDLTSARNVFVTLVDKWFVICTIASVAGTMEITLARCIIYNANSLDEYMRPSLVIINLI